MVTYTLSLPMSIYVYTQADYKAIAIKWCQICSSHLCTNGLELLD